MKIEMVKINGIHIAEIHSETVVIGDTQDALDMMAECAYQGSYKIIVQQKNIRPEFFDLKTGIAGEVLQKFSNYRAQLAIVGDFSTITSKSLKDFIFESNKTGRIFFAPTLEAARKALSDK